MTEVLCCGALEYLINFFGVTMSVIGIPARLPALGSPYNCLAAVKSRFLWSLFSTSPPPLSTILGGHTVIQRCCVERGSEVFIFYFLKGEKQKKMCGIQGHDCGLGCKV